MKYKLELTYDEEANSIEVLAEVVGDKDESQTIN